MAFHGDMLLSCSWSASSFALVILLSCKLSNVKALFATLLHVSVWRNLAGLESSMCVNVNASNVRTIVDWVNCRASLYSMTWTCSGNRECTVPGHCTVSHQMCDGVLVPRNCGFIIICLNAKSERTKKKQQLKKTHKNKIFSFVETKNNWDGAVCVREWCNQSGCI